MPECIRTIWQPPATAQPVNQILLPPSATTSTNGMEKQRLIKLEPPMSPVSDSESHSGKAQRMARVTARRDKRKPSEAADAAPVRKKLKTETAREFRGEERLRSMEAQLEHLDPDSKEAKKKRRLIRNRMSAQLHRERKKAYVGQLEDQLQAKENQLKALQEQLAAMAVESEQLKQQLSRRKAVDKEPQIKVEPVLLDKGAQPAMVPDEQSAVDWTVCLEDVDEAMVGEDLLCDLDDSPLAAYGLHSVREDPVTAALAEEEERQKLQAQVQSHHEIHAAKKNLAMMMAMMFSVTFCGQGESVANVTNGSNFSSMLNAGPVKELSQMSIASRIVACLEKTSWEDFQDVSSWTASAASAAAAATAVAVSADKKSRSSLPQKPADSPSATSDVTDAGSCGSPKELEDVGMSFDTDLIEEFVYPVDEPFVPALADTNWFGADSADFGHSDVEGDNEFISETTTTFKPVSMTSCLYEKLTKLWNEKNQVILTVLNGKNEVTRRSVADMSTIRKGMFTRALFPTTATTAAASSNDKLLKKHDQSITFLYPLSAFSEDQRSAAFPNGGASDQVFLEVSCQIKGAANPVL